MQNVPNAASANYGATKTNASKSYSHNQFPNHFAGEDIQTQFEPTFVKLDKQVRNLSCILHDILKSLSVTPTYQHTQVTQPIYEFCQTNVYFTLCNNHQPIAASAFRWSNR